MAEKPSQVPRHGSSATALEPSVTALESSVTALEPSVTALGSSAVGLGSSAVAHAQMPRHFGGDDGDG